MCLVQSRNFSLSHFSLKSGPMLDACLPIVCPVGPDGYPHVISMSCNACTTYGLHQRVLLASLNCKSKQCIYCGSIHDFDIPFPILELANPRRHHISCQSAEPRGSVNCRSQQQHDESLQLELVHRVADVLCCHTLLWHSGCIQPVSSKLHNVETARDLLQTWSEHYM